jgi:hypothetical protein
MALRAMDSSTDRRGDAAIRPIHTAARDNAGR